MSRLYALRRTMPSWKYKPLLDELVEYCNENSIDEVILKVDTEEFSHGHPSLKWLNDYKGIMEEIKDTLTNNNIIFSINPWITVGHTDRGRDSKAVYPEIDLMVGHDGAQCTHCACHLSEGFRKVNTDLWSIYASLEPSVLWIEDDIRLHNHAPALLACFCDIHMSKFSEYIGKDITREELVKEIYKIGEPTEIRKKWLDFNRETINEVGSYFNRIVTDISRKTKLGLMTSMPKAHAVEGRDWKGFRENLAGSEGLFVRPCMCNYAEHGLRDLYFSALMIQQTMHLMGDDVVYQTELDNVPFTQYSKSIAFTKLQIFMSMANGSDGVTMNLYDHMGTLMSITPEYGKLLKDIKPALETLKIDCLHSKSHGIGFVFDQDNAYYSHVKHPESWFDTATSGDHLYDSILGLGFTTTYEESDVTILSGDMVRGFSKDKIIGLLSKGVLIDLDAYMALDEMGYGEYLGAKFVKKYYRDDKVVSGEEYFNKDFGGDDRKYLTLILPGLGTNFYFADTTAFDDAIVVSKIVDPDTNYVANMVTLYENKLGGRVAFYGVNFDDAIGVAFNHPFRKEQLSNIFKWLGKGSPAIEVSGGYYPYSFVQEKDDHIVAGVFNLSLDPWDKVVIDIPKNIVKSKVSIKKLDIASGNWVEDKNVSYTEENDKITIKYNNSLPSCDIFIVKLD